MSTGYFSHRSKLYLTDLFNGLVTANHILHNKDVVDGYGHISVRNPDAPDDAFFMAHAIAPALVSSQADIVQYSIATGEPLEKSDETKSNFIERYIHSEIYKKFPGVNCVVHSHAPEVLPFSINHVPLKAPVHTSAFLGKLSFCFASFSAWQLAPIALPFYKDGLLNVIRGRTGTDTPVWDIGSTYSSGDPHDMLVRSKKLGGALAQCFAKPATSVNFIRTKLTETITGTHNGPSTTPDFPVVLMRGHGFTVAGPGIEETVYMAIYTVQAAKIQTSALLLSNAYFAGKIEGNVDSDNGGKIKNGTIKNPKEPHYLSGREVKDATEAIWNTAQRPWQLWKREVECLPLYVNACSSEGEEGG